MYCFWKLLGICFLLHCQRRCVTIDISNPHFLLKNSLKTLKKTLIVTAFALLFFYSSVPLWYPILSEMCRYSEYSDSIVKIVVNTNLNVLIIIFFNSEKEEVKETLHFWFRFYLFIYFCFVLFYFMFLFAYILFIRIFIVTDCEFVYRDTYGGISIYNADNLTTSILMTNITFVSLAQLNIGIRTTQNF